MSEHVWCFEIFWWEMILFFVILNNPQFERSVWRKWTRAVRHVMDLLGDLRFLPVVLLAVTWYLSELWTARFNLNRQWMSFSGRWTRDGVPCPRQRFFPSQQNWKWHSSASAAPDSGSLRSVRLHGADLHQPESLHLRVSSHTQQRGFHNRNEIFTHDSFQETLYWSYRSLRWLFWNCFEK